MSIEAVAAVLHHSQATPTGKLVLTAIAWHLGEDPSTGCYPSQHTLAHYANINVRQVRRALDQLVELGEIEVWKHGGRRVASTPASNLYFLLLDCPPGCDNSLQHRQNVGVINGMPTGNLRLVKR
jgi:hypothetical protein